MKTIHEAWASFSGEVMPRGVSAEQYTEMRRAFYAGAWALLGLMKSIDDQLSDDEGVEVVMALEQEMKDFALRVRKGEA